MMVESPMPKPVLIFANPIAGRGKGRAIAERLRARLVRERLDAQAEFTRADRIPDDDLPANLYAAIAIGGDGTVRGVVRRLFQRYGERTPPTLVVPMGTANLLGKHLGTRWNDADLPDEVAAAIKHMKTLRLDAALANDELFLLMAGIGLDAKVVHELDRVRSGPIDYTSYALPAALALGFYSYPPLTVTVDGKTICKKLPAFAFIGNVKEYGTGFPVLPDARPDDGLLDVCVLPAANRADAIRHVLRAAAGEHVGSEGVLYTRGKDIKIESPEQVPVQIDGEAAGHTPLHCKLLPVRLPFIVP
jgi:YegS/Rv2252/BmrU family lipid kinase